jgi:5-(carboxyamino)imidazole ribonucleotide mutase
MPGGVPVATVALNGAKNAGILAAQIISASNSQVRETIIEYKASLREQVINKSKRLEK